MNKIKNSPLEAKDAEEKEENQLDRILDSNASKKLFPWAKNPDSSCETEAIVAEMKEEQRLRWNFDFQTETPLPGRYQWVRTSSTAHQKNGNGKVECKNSRRLNSPYCRKTKTEQSSNLRSEGSCDTSLNGPRRSERKTHQVQHYGRTCGQWN